MARRIINQFVDDIDGSEDDVRTVQFSVPFDHDPRVTTATTTYRIDLGPENRAALRKALEPFIQHAERVTGYDPDAARPGEAKKIREWAASKGIELSPRGRFPKNVVRQYREETR